MKHGEIGHFSCRAPHGARGLKYGLLYVAGAVLGRRAPYGARGLKFLLTLLEEYYPTKTIDRVESVLREQMRKYPVKFLRGNNN